MLVSYKMFIKNGCDIYLVASILFVFLMPFKGIAGPSDSLITKYNLNDPRNPNCPCHLYQKMAEKEHEMKQKDVIELLIKIRKMKVNKSTQLRVKKHYVSIKNLKINYSKKKHAPKQKKHFFKGIWIKKVNDCNVF